MTGKGLLACILFASFLAAGCSSVKSNIKFSDSQPDPASPPDGGFAFALRTTAVMLTTQGNAKDDSKPKKSEQPAAAREASAPVAGDKKALAAVHGTPPKDKAATPAVEAKNPPAPPSAGDNEKPPASNAKTPSVVPVDACPANVGVDWASCVHGVSLSEAPVSTQNTIYVAMPDPGMGAKTTLTPKQNDTDPLLLTSVTFNSTSKLSSSITAAGTDAIVGLTWGPWGAAAGGLLGFILGETSPNAALNAPPSLAWKQFVCKEDASLAESKDPSDSAKLMLPVTIDYDNADDPCWSSLPVATGFQPADKKATVPLSGWFYRFTPRSTLPPNASAFPPVVLDPKNAPSNIRPASQYFTKASGSAWTATDNTFPASACRAVNLEFTFWTALSQATITKKDPTAQSYPLVVADPHFVQSIRAPAQGSVTLLPLCGGYASGSVSSSVLNDSINAMLTQVKAYRDAQKSSSGKKQ